MSTPRDGSQSFRGRGSSRGTRFPTSTARGGRGRNSKSPNPPTATENVTNNTPNGYRGGGSGRAKFTSTPGLTRGAGNTTSRGASIPFTRGGQQGHGRGSNASHGGKPLNARAKMEIEPWRLPENAHTADYKQRMEKKFRELQERRLQEVDQAVAEGKMAAEGAQMDLKNAIAKVGTCEDMCPEYERAERIFQNMVDHCEMIRLGNGKLVPCEDRMVLSYKKSAAGRGEVPPSDILSVPAVKRTLDYLLDDLIGGESGFTPKVHAFIWNRTRELRKTLRIQAHGPPEVVQTIIECFELIVRFHIFSLHHWSNPDSAKIYKEWESYQEFEQLRNSMTELSNLYSDHATVVQSPNEAEFRSYEIIMAIRHEKARIEDAVHSWRINVINDKRVQLARELYAAAGSLIDVLGPARLGQAISNSIASTPAIVQGNSMDFWSLLKQKQTPFLMGCVAELTFANARRTALVELQKAYNRPKVGAQEDLIMSDVTRMLGFDTEDEAIDFCEEHGFQVGERADGNAFLKLHNNPVDVYAISQTVHFSRSIVDAKRRGRMPLAIIRSLRFSDALAQGLVDRSQSRSARQPADNGARVPENPFQKPASIPTPENPFAKPSQAPAANPFSKPTAATGLFAPGNPFAQPVGGNSQPALSNTEIAKRVFNTPSITPLASPSTWQQSQGSSKTSTTPSQLASTATSTPNPFGFASKPLSGGASNSTAHPASSSPSPFALSSKPSAGGVDAPAAKASPFFSQPSAPTVNPPQSSFITQPVPTCDPTKTSSSSLFSPTAPKVPEESSEPLFVPEDPPPKPKPATISFFPPTSTTPTLTPSQETPPPSSSVLPAFNSGSKKPLFQTFPGTTQPPSIAPSTLPTTLSTPQIQPAFTSAKNTSDASRQPLFATPATAAPTSAGQTTSAVSSQPSVSFASGEAKASFGTTPSSVKNVQASLEPKRTVQPAGPPAPPPPPPGPPRKETLAKLANAVLHGPEGLLQQFLEHEIGNTIRLCVRKVQREHETARIADARRYLLVRKYSRRWKDAAWKRKLQRNAKKRRAEFAQSMREMALASRENSRAGSDSPAPHFEPFTSLTDTRAAASMLPPPKPSQPRKSHRSSLPADSKLQQTPGNHSERHLTNHKRSKQRSDSNAQPTMNGTNSQAQFGKSAYRSRAAVPNVAGEALIDTERLMRQASRLVSGRTDTTRSDYFKLKSLGIDPETTIVPKTQPRKRSYDDDDGSEEIARKSRASPAKGVAASRSPDMSSSSKYPRLSESKAEQSRIDASSTLDNDDDDDLFAQIAAVKKQMADDAAWFRDARAQSERSSMERANETDKQRKLREWKPSVNRTESRWQREGLPSFLRAPWTPRESVSRSASRLSDTQKEQQPVANHVKATAENSYDYEDGDAEEDDEEDEADDQSSHFQDDGEYYEDEEEEEEETDEGEEYDDDGIDTQALNLNSAFAAKGASVDDAIEL